MKKKQLSILGQIKHMSEKGITFHDLEKKDVENFLQEDNYYFRVKSYAKNYTKVSNSYIDLDFAYLRELSTIDFHLRRSLLRMTLEIEHRLKVKLLERLLVIENIDAYTIIEDFFKAHSHVEADIRKKYELYIKIKNDKKPLTSYTANLMLKYYPNFPIWVITELVSFGAFMQLYKFCYKQIKKKTPHESLLWSTKIIRNACAHNNCLLNNLSSKIVPNTAKRVTVLLSKTPSTKPYYEKYKECHVIMDIITVLALYNDLVSSPSEKETTYQELKTMVIDKVLQNMSFYNNKLIYENFEFLDKVNDLFLKSTKTHNK